MVTPGITLLLLYTFPPLRVEPAETTVALLVIWTKIGADGNGEGGRGVWSVVQKDETASPSLSLSRLDRDPVSVKVTPPLH